MEDATRRHFFFHGESGFQREKVNCHFCQLRSFATHARYPVTIVNNEDDAVLDPSFRFTDRSVLGKGVEPTKDEFRSGCVCTDAEDCQYSSCHCLQDMDDNSGDDGDGDGNYGQYRRKTYAYHSHGVRAGHLRSKILTSRDPIYECHEGCACGPDCPNRVVERGRRVPLQVFRTANRGWGVRSTVDIRKGQFVDKYVGEVITAAEAARRRARSHIAQRKDVYLFALDKFSDPASLDERLRGPPLEVDGEFLSGPTRFVNHSCDPNLRIFARVGDHADKHIHDLALFAIRDIPKGEELTFDYVDGVDEEDNDALDPEKQKDMARCLCGNTASWVNATGFKGCCFSRAAGPNAPYPGGGAPTPSARAINSHAPPVLRSSTTEDSIAGGAASTAASPRSRPTEEPESLFQGHGHSRRNNHRDRRTSQQQPLSQHIDKPLRRHRWTAKNRPWTRTVLDTERADFFDTRVTGRQEVWQVLHAALQVLWEADLRRAAAAAARENDHLDGDDDGEALAKQDADAEVSLATAQSILRAAEITLPTGDLVHGVYDSLGNYYALPEWIVCDPDNVAEDSGARAADRKAGEDDDGEEGLDEDMDKDAALRRREEKGKAVANVRNTVKVCARLSENSRDVTVRVGADDSVRKVARKVVEESGLPSSKRIRLAYMGKILKENSSLQAQGWQKGHIVNALVFNQ
ncbi:hypothetical protein DL765_005211 [Monosporascus sp. GIB2]|nr:hypothetical protein DL765_005211 [Monosporascus sp. GIB2]